jgi:hypothetical protein
VRIEDLIAEVRPRNRWEAMDLGLLMARKHLGAILRAWVVLVWPVWAVILLAFQGNLPWGMVVIWLTKPLAERVPLLVLSRELFGESLTLRQLAGQWRMIWLSDLWYALSGGRISTRRHVVLPLRQLEGLRSRPFTLREVRFKGPCGTLPLAMQIGHLIVLHGLWITVAGFIVSMAPHELQDEVASIWQEGLWFEEIGAPLRWICILCYLAALTLVTPFCVGSGFGLYLNLRTKMEGWDIEISFRKLAARLARVALGVSLLVPWLAGDCRAQDAWQPEKAVKEILEDPAFTIHTKRIWVPDLPDVPAPPDAPELPGITPVPVSWINPLFLQPVLVLLGLILLVAVVWKFRKTWGGFLRTNVRKSVVSTVMGMSVREESLPKNLIDLVRSLLAGGDFEGAMGLLYRGALVWLIHRGQVPIQESDTESDCLMRVEALPGVSADYFGRLTQVWSAAAYGARRAGMEEVEHLLRAWPYDLAGKEAGKP